MLRTRRYQVLNTLSTLLCNTPTVIRLSVHKKGGVAKAYVLRSFLWKSAPHCCTPPAGQGDASKLGVQVKTLREMLDRLRREMDITMQTQQLEKQAHIAEWSEKLQVGGLSHGESHVLHKKLCAPATQWLSRVLHLAHSNYYIMNDYIVYKVIICYYQSFPIVAGEVDNLVTAHRGEWHVLVAGSVLLSFQTQSCAMALWQMFTAL